MRIVSTGSSVLVAFALLAGSGRALAQSPAELNLAKQTAGEGLAAYSAGEFDKALGLFNQAKKIYPSAQILRMIGYSELALEHWVKAADAMHDALNSTVTPLSKDDRKDVEDNLAKANAHLGTVTLHCKGANVKVVVDGGDAQPCTGDKPQLHLAEGPHKFVASAPDRIDATADLKVDGGKSFDVPLEPAAKAAPFVVVAPPPPPPPPPAAKGLFPHQREVGYGLVGGGVLAGIGALVTVIEAARWRSMTNSDVAKHLSLYGQGCTMGDPRLCAYDINVTNGEGTTANELRNASIGLGVTALVLAGGGVALIVLAPKHPAPPRDDAPPAAPPVSMRCGAGGLSLTCSGAF